jgi:subtilisin-like proprotein convertase family protein
MRRWAWLLTFMLLGSVASTSAAGSTTRSERGTAVEVPDDAGFVVAGSVTKTGAGIVRVFADRDQNGSYEKLVQEFSPYGNAKVGTGIRVALGDFNGDGNDELVTASGAATAVKVYEMGSDGTVGNQALAIGGFPKGAFVATGDIDNDGRDELVAAAGTGSAPKVTIRNDPSSSGVPSHVVDTFQAYGATFKGGVTVALGNTDNTVGAELITAPASGKGKVRIYHNADSDTTVSDDPLKESFFAYGPSFAGGVTVAAGEIQGVGNGGAEIAVAPASGKGKVRILTDTNASGTVSDEPEFESFFPYGAGFAGGVRVAMGDTDGSSFFVEVLVEPAVGAGARQLKIYDDTGDAGAFISDNPLGASITAFPATVTAGGFAGFGKVTNGVFTFAAFPQTIPDQATLTTTILVPKSAGIIRDLDVSFHAAHSFDGDLDVTLTHVPIGTSLLLFNDVGGSNEGFDIRLNDEAGTDIAGASNPKPDGEISGTFNPIGGNVLAVFDGQDASGAWRLSVTDDSGGDVGTLFGWTLYVSF